MYEKAQAILTKSGRDMTDQKLLFTNCHYAQGGLVFFQSGSPLAIYFHIPRTDSTRIITSSNDVTEIINCINDKGIKSLQTQLIGVD